MIYMKKIFIYFSALICLIAAVSCEKGREETTPSVITADQYTLTYSSGENGSIDGISPQIVAHGGDGSPVTAIPAEHHHFVDWSDGVSTAIRTDQKVTADLAVTANFAIDQYTLTHTAGENGSIDGVSPQTVAHGGDGSPVTAVPAEHHHFVDWSDGVSTAQRLDSNLKTDLAVTANFAIDQYSLTYTAEENGTIQGISSQKIDHGNSGSKVTAVPAEGYHFVSWSDGINKPDRTESEVTADLSVSAAFTINKYTLNYKAGKNGSINGANPQTVVHGSDASPVTAVSSEHHHFVNWSDGISTPDRTDRKVKGNLAMTANFAVDQYSRIYTADENGTIEGISSQKIGHGSSGSKVTAVPDEGYHFVNWSDGVTTASRTDQKVTADLAVTANFAINQYTLTYTAGKNGSLEGVLVQTVNHGSDSSPVTAVAERNYHFVSWSDGVTTAQRIDSKVRSNLTVSAVFAVNTYTIGGSVTGLLEGTQVILTNNGGDDLTITANGDFIFTAKLPHADTYDVMVLTQPTSPNQTCTVTSGAGTIAYENITDVVVTCIPTTYTIGGIVSGIPEGDQIIMRYNDGNDLVVNVNGSFTFATPLDDGSTYKITIHSQPKRPNWDCKIENAAGTLTGMNVTDIIVDCYPEAVLQSKAGFKKVELNWNSQDFNEIHSNKVVFNICRTEEKIPPDSFRSCRNFAGGVLKKRAASPLTVQQLTNDTPYWFQIQVLAASGSRRTYSEVVMAIPYGGLNDTGIDWCSDEITNLSVDGTRVQKTEGCETLLATHPGQDAVYGWDVLARDRKVKKTGSGSAGFDFTKLCKGGAPANEGNCPPNPLQGSGPDNWACTRDNVTGLTWEIKIDKGLRSQDNTYTWYREDKTYNADYSGLKNGGSCEGSDCDTHAYIKAINDMELCGASDWRLPTKSELLSIVDNSRFKPAIDERFFPMTLPSYYWTSSPYPDQPDSAWQVYFLYGEALPGKKGQSSAVRLVRGRTVTFGRNNP